MMLRSGEIRMLRLKTSLKSAARRVLAVLPAASVICLVLVLTPAPGLTAQGLNSQPPPEEWSRLVHQYYQNLKSMHATFEQIITHRESAVEEQRTGELYFKKPFLARWASDEPYPEVLLVKENVLWQFFPEEKLALKFSVEDINAQSEFLTVITGQVPLSDKFKISPREESEGVQSLRLTPHSPSTSLVEATIWVDIESGIILRLLFSDFYGNLNDISFTNQEPDVSIPPDIFAFTPPPGTTVEDYTQR